MSAGSSVLRLKVEGSPTDARSASVQAATSTVLPHGDWRRGRRVSTLRQKAASSRLECAHPHGSASPVCTQPPWQPWTRNAVLGGSVRTTAAVPFSPVRTMEPWRAATRSFDCCEAAWKKGFVARHVLRRRCWRTPSLGERQRCPVPIHALCCHPAWSSTGPRSTLIDCIAAHLAEGSGRCPTCGGRSDRVHSLHRRRLLDLPSHGHAVVLVVRFRCAASDCPRRTFAKRLPPGTAVGSGRRTARLDGLVRDLGAVLGDRPGSGLARRLMLPVRKDAVLRAIRRSSPPEAGATRVIGIDEWAWRRRQRYGTLICNAERRRVVDLLPDREPATVRAWLSTHPHVRVVARDRADGYAAVAAEAAPQAVQVADRWHLMENASAAFLEAVRSVLGPIRRALGTGAVDLGLLSAAERLQCQCYLRRRDENKAIRAMAGAGTAVKEIGRRTGRSRKLVRAVPRDTEDEVFRSRASSLAPWLVALEATWSGGCRNGAELWRRLRAKGFGGSCGRWASGPTAADAASVPTAPSPANRRRPGPSPAHCWSGATA